MKMREHQRFVYNQLIIWHASENMKEIAKAAAERDLSSFERESEAEARRLAQAERNLMREERAKSSANMSEIFEQLSEVRTHMRRLEEKNKGEQGHQFQVRALISKLADAEFHSI